MHYPNRAALDGLSRISLACLGTFHHRPFHVRSQWACDDEKEESDELFGALTLNS